MSIPNTRVPMFAVEFDDSLAFQGSSILAYKVLLTGQMTSSGTATAGQFYRLNEQIPDQYFGVGSDLARMANKWFENNKFTEVWAYPYADPSGVAAVGHITVTHAATGDGEIALLIDGTRIAISVANLDSVNDIATDIRTAINADTSLPVAATGSDADVVLTAKNVGIIGNDIDVQVNYYDGEVLPSGVTLTIIPIGTASTGVPGTGSVDLATMIAAMGEDWYNMICGSMNDATNLGLIEVELASRFGPLRMIDGIYFCARRGIGADRATKNTELIAFGTSRNSKHVCCMNASYIPNSPSVWAAGITAQASYEGAIDPNRPLQNLFVPGILPPKRGQRNTLSDNNALLMDGISTFDVIGSEVIIQRAITMFQTNSAGSPSISYLNVETMLTLMYMRYDFRTTIRTKYPRAKLANDGVRVQSGMQVMTPSVGKAEALSIFRKWEYMGLVEDVTQFKRDLICIRSNTDPDRLEWTMSPNLINQFRVGAALIQFLLESSAV
jgi:phage tail sheath gpL-like